jgi:dienelactone hydrolase
MRGGRERRGVRVRLAAPTRQLPRGHNSKEVPMNSRALTAVVLLASFAGGASAQQIPYGPPTVTPPYDSIVVTEPVAGSDIPVDIMLLETVDGLLTPIGLRKPKGAGPFPIVLLFTGNGGAGIPAVRNYVHGPAGYTMSRFLDAGYAVAWITYRAEAWFAYETAQPLKVSHHQANQLLNRPALEYNDLISIVEGVRRLPFVDARRVGLIGNSHGGGMILKAGAEGLDVAAAIVSEPDASEFLQLDPKVFDVEEAQLQTMDKVLPHVNKKIALERMRRIKVPLMFMNRDHDHMQGLFETAYEWAKEAGLNPEHVSYDHDVHGYVLRVKQDASGKYQPDEIQLKAIGQAIDFFNRKMK